MMVTVKNFALFVMIALNLSGCATKRFVMDLNNQTNHDIALLNERMDRLYADLDVFENQVQANVRKIEEHMSGLRGDWTVFTRNYSPEIHMSIKENQQLIDEHTARIAESDRIARRDQERIAEMRADAGRNLETVRENARESDVLNVVNEFQRLQQDWSSTYARIVHETDRANNATLDAALAAGDAARSASNAEEYSRAAERQSDKVNQFADTIYRLEHNLGYAAGSIDSLAGVDRDMKSRMDRLVRQIDKLDREVNQLRSQLQRVSQEK